MSAAKSSLATVWDMDTITFGDVESLYAPIPDSDPPRYYAEVAVFTDDWRLTFPTDAEDQASDEQLLEGVLEVFEQETGWNPFDVDEARASVWRADRQWTWSEPTYD